MIPPNPPVKKTRKPKQATIPTIQETKPADPEVLQVAKAIDAKLSVNFRNDSKWFWGSLGAAAGAALSGAVIKLAEYFLK